MGFPVGPGQSQISSTSQTASFRSIHSMADCGMILADSSPTMIRITVMSEWAVTRPGRIGSPPDIVSPGWPNVVFEAKSNQFESGDELIELR